MIENVKIKKLKVISDERGRLMEILRCDDEIFKKFGQVYMTTVLPGVVKGWHYHKKQTDTFVCLFGMVKVVLYDNRESSGTYKQVQEFFIGVHNPVILQVPPFVVHGFKGIGENEAILMNVPDIAYDYSEPDEYRIPPHSEEIPYDWARKDG